MPGAQGYRVEVLGVAAESVEMFREKHSRVVGDLLALQIKSNLRIETGPALAAAWQHLLDLWLKERSPQPDIARHRLEESLLCLAQQGAGQAIFFGTMHGPSACA